jgi:hypothetical protein
MSFLAAAPATPATPPQPVLNDGWWPDVDVQQLQAGMRIDGSVTPERLRNAVVNAVASVNRQCAAWRARQQAAGAGALEDVAASEIDGRSVLVTYYLRAVTCAASAELIERMRGYDTTAAGERQVDAVNPALGELRRDELWAISDLTGTGRTTVELI